LTKLSHPYVLPLLGVAVVSETDIRLVLPLMSKGNLASHIASLDRKLVLPILKQIAWGLEYLHTKNMIHRDLSTTQLIISQANAYKTSLVL